MRRLILMAGPPIIVAACYWLSMTGSNSGLAGLRASAQAGGVAEQVSVDEQPTTLETLCQRKAQQLWPQLNRGCRIIVRPPYILAGDMSDDQLHRYHRNLIVPISRALSTSYFERRPDEPIIVLIFSSQKQYRDHALRLDRRRTANNYGYYQRSDRRIVLNVATGNGTLAHELTHALAHFDFPALPKWFDEGLATVHEQCRFSEDRLQLEGLPNWRRHHLLAAIHSNRLETLKSLVVKASLASEQTALDYAYVRYFCLYLQHRRLLSPFYRKFRSAVDRDPTGIRTLQELLQVESLSVVDDDFRKWVEALGPRHR